MKSVASATPSGKKNTMYRMNVTYYPADTNKEKMAPGLSLGLVTFYFTSHIYCRLSFHAYRYYYQSISTANLLYRLAYVIDPKALLCSN